MLKSTHKEVPLPPGWTSHKAPTGHTYYYNSETKKSTYTRPALEQPPHSPPIIAPQAPYTPAHTFTSYQSPTLFHHGHYNPQVTGANSTPLHGANATPLNPQHSNHQPRQRRDPDDRPKSKHALPGCAPWVLVKTKLGRRFVHNPVTNESFWNYPKEVASGVAEFDIRERKRAAGETVEEEEQQEERHVLGVTPVRSTAEENNAAPQASRSPSRGDAEAGGVSERPKDEEGEEDVIYEEVEVTDDEYSEADNPPKRLRGYDEDADGNEEEQAENEQPEREQPLEFTEDDMAWQLAQLGETYQLDPGEYAGEEDYFEEGAEGLGMTEEECLAAFHDLLNDYGINPYKTWDSIIEDGTIISDDRYTLLSNMGARRKAFSEWSTSKIQALKEEKERMVRLDPRIPYLDLLARHASPKLFWPEFRRKFKKEPELKDMKLPEKEKERLYREHISRVTKMSEGMLKADLETLLKTVPVSRTWNRETSLEVLPAVVLADVRYISSKPAVRDQIVEGVIRKLPRREDLQDEEDSTEARGAREDRKKRDEALRERQWRVQQEKRRQERELQFGRNRLRDGEAELDRAMRVGKEGLRGALEE